MTEQVKDSFVDTPRGIFAANGLWFRTTLESLREFAGEVLEKEPVEMLIEKSAVIYRSARSVGLWALIVSLVAAPPWIAIIVSLLTYVSWSFVRKSVGGHGIFQVLKILENVGVQLVVFAAALIWLAMWPDIAKVVVGLLGFILYRWNIVDMLLKPLVERSDKIPSVPDQILKAVIVQSAIKHRISLDYLKKMEESMQRAMRFNK